MTWQCTDRSRGFTYLGVLFIISVLGLTAAMASVVWSTAQRRENERQLMFAGRQFRLAIERYAQRAPSARVRYPRQLEDLLRDPRALNVVRDLRQIYVDPMTGERQWGLIKQPDGSIVGVHSLSDRAPLKGNFAATDDSRAKGETYRDWRFIVESADEAAPAASPIASPTPQH